MDDQVTWMKYVFLYYDEYLDQEVRQLESHNIELYTYLNCTANSRRADYNTDCGELPIRENSRRRLVHEGGPLLDESAAGVQVGS